MHELAIAQAIADGVCAHAVEERAVRVTSVRVRIGEAAGVLADSLIGCFELLASEEPLLCGARLVIERVPHRARCRRCGQEFAVENFVVRCPACDTWEAQVIGGTELEVREMEIETRAEGA